MLQVKEISTEYGGMKALDRVSVMLGQNEFVSIISLMAWQKHSSENYLWDRKV
jgi:ABC-type branched-subunit amino acid transport system ATPase component